MSEKPTNVTPMVANRWGDLALSEQLDAVWCVEVDIVRTREGRHEVMVSAYGHDEQRIDVPALRGMVGISPPAMYPYDCPLPLWLAYSAVSQMTEAFLRESSEFTLG